MTSHATVASVVSVATVEVKSAAVPSLSDSRIVAAVVDSPQTPAADLRIAPPPRDVPSQSYRNNRDLKSRMVLDLDLVPGPSFDLVVVAFPVPLATASVARVAVALNDEVASPEDAEVSESGMLDLDCHLSADLVTGLDEDGAGEAFEHWSEQRCPALQLVDSATLLSPENNLSRNSAFA